jgi:hypothetical protein
MGMNVMNEMNDERNVTEEKNHCSYGAQPNRRVITFIFFKFVSFALHTRTASCARLFSSGLRRSPSNPLPLVVAASAMCLVCR